MEVILRILCSVLIADEDEVIAVNINPSGDDIDEQASPFLHDDRLNSRSYIINGCGAKQHIYQVLLV